MSLALAENPQVAQALSIGGGGGGGVTTLNGLNGSITLTSTDDSLAFNQNAGSIDINANVLVRSITVNGTTVVSGQASLLQGSNITIDANAETDTITISSTIPVEAGVVSLQGLAGALTFTSSDDSININPSGTTIDLTSNGGGGAGVASLSDGTTALTGAITLIGEGCSITATQDPSPAITISIPAPPESGVSSVSDGTNVATGAVVISGGEGIEIGYDPDQNTFTLTSDPFVGIYYLTTPQDITLVPPTQVQKVVGLTADPNTDSVIVSYDAGLGTWVVQKSGVYFLNFSAGIIQNNATWTFGSFCQCYIVCILGGSSPQLEICNSTTPSPTSGVNSFNAQVFGYLPLTVGTTITAGIQWIITSAGTPTPAQFQPRVNNINNGTGFNWAYVKPLTA